MSARRALPGVAVLLVAAGLLSLPSASAPGHRGARRVAPGFRPGRWDATHSVARRPAQVRVPEPARVTLVLSGPASVSVHHGDVRHSWSVGASPAPLHLNVDPSTPVELVPEGALRLHSAEVRRLRGPPAARAAVLVAALFVVLVASRWGGGAWWGLAAALLATLLSLPGTLAPLLVRMAGDRYGPVLGFAALLSLAAAPWLLPRRGEQGTGGRVPALFGLIVLSSCLLQVALFRQPALLGDPGVYYGIGGQFLDAARTVRGPDTLAAALEQIRPYAGLGFAGALYAAARALHDAPASVYVLHSLAMGAAVFFLVRAALRLGGPRLAWVCGTLAALYPTLAVVVGIAQPEPVVLMLWTFALDRTLAARDSGSLRSRGLAGLAFGAGLALHPQGLWFLVAVMLLALAAAAVLRPATVRWAAVTAFSAGFLPVLCLLAAGERYARPAAAVLERHGFWAYTLDVPIGFWLFLETDGWQGSLRLADTEYVRAFEAARRAGAIEGSADAALHTVRSLAARPLASAIAVLRNVDRLFGRPDNPPRRNWLLPYPVQVRWHRALFALFLLAVPLLLAGRAGVVLVPTLMLALTYPLYHVFSKYAVPAVPFLLLGAALTLLRIARERPPVLLGALVAAGAAALLGPVPLALLGLPPLAGFAVVEAVRLGGLLIAFAYAARRWAEDRRGQVATGLGAAFLVLPTAAASWADAGWRRFSVPLSRPVHHEVEGPLHRLADAAEAYLVLDLHVPSGDPRGLRLRFDSGAVVDGSSLQPSMPAHALATHRMGRDPRSLPQWWRVRWQPVMAAGGRMGVTITGTGRERLFGRLDSGGTPNVRCGPSFGEWPRASVYRLMYEDEYRLPACYPLQADARRSAWDGDPLPGALGVHLIALNAGGLTEWRTGSAPAPEIASAVWARAGRHVEAVLETPSGALPLMLGSAGRWLGPAAEARLVPTGDLEGWFLVRTAAVPGQPVVFRVRLPHHMSPVPRFFVPELQREGPPLPAEWAGVPYVPPVEVLRAVPPPRWRPILVF